MYRPGNITINHSRTPILRRYVTGPPTGDLALRRSAILRRYATSGPILFIYFFIKFFYFLFFLLICSFVHSFIQIQKNILLIANKL